MQWTRRQPLNIDSSPVSTGTRSILITKFVSLRAALSKLLLIANISMKLAMSQVQRRDSAKTEVSFDSAMVKLWKDWTSHYGQVMKMLLAMVTRMVTNNGHMNDYRDATSRQCCASISSALGSIALFCLRPTSDNRAWRILSQPHRIWILLTLWTGTYQRRARGNWDHLLLCTSLTTC